MQRLINVFIAIVVFIVIYKYLVPLLPPPIGAIALILIVVAVIVWLLGEVRN